MKLKKNPIIVSPALNEKNNRSNYEKEPTQISLIPLEKEKTTLGFKNEKIEQHEFKEKAEELIQEEINIYELVIDRIGDSKTHGVGNIVKAKSWILKLVWIVCFLVSVAYCIYECVIALIVYFQYPVIPTPSPIYEAPTVFPSIDICNVVSYDAVTTASYIQNILNTYNISASNYANTKDYTNQVSTLIKANLAKQQIKRLFDGFNSGYNLPDMMISCFFEGEACNQSNFYQYQDFNYDNCFSFNLGAVNNAGGPSGTWLGNFTVTTGIPFLTASFPGEAKGFQLEMFTGSPDNQQFSANNGLRVIIHNQSVAPFPIDNGIDIPTGMQTNLVVKRTFYYHLNAPYSNCLTDPVDYTQNSILQTYYSNYSSGNVVPLVYKQSYCLNLFTIYK